MKPIVINVVSTLASVGVSTVVVNVVKNNTPKYLSLYSKLMVGLGTFVLSGVLADICSERLVDMIDEAIPTKPRVDMIDDVMPPKPLGSTRASDIQHGAELIQRYANELMAVGNPDAPDPIMFPELMRIFCLDNNLDVHNYEFVRPSGDDFGKLITVQVVNGS